MTYFKEHLQRQNKRIEKALRNEFYNSYLTKNKRDKLILSKTDEHKIALAEFFHQLQEQDNRILFHISITYRQYQDRNYSENDINNFFKNIYQRFLLPYIMNTKRYSTNRQRQFQPICLTFIDEHTKPHRYKLLNESKDKIRLEALKEYDIDYSNENNFLLKPKPKYVEYPLHHHCIIAIHKDHLLRFNKFIGTNTLVRNPIDENNENKKYLSVIKTSDIRPCNAMRLLYASKKLYKYPEFQLFPPSYKRRNNVNKIYTKTDPKLRSIVTTRIHTDPSDINTPMISVQKNVKSI